MLHDAFLKNCYCSRKIKPCYISRRIQLYIVISRTGFLLLVSFFLYDLFLCFYCRDNVCFGYHVWRVLVYLSVISLFFSYLSFTLSIIYVKAVVLRYLGLGWPGILLLFCKLLLLRVRPYTANRLSRDWSNLYPSVSLTSFVYSY